MNVIIDNKNYLTNGVSVSIPYDINQLDLSGTKIQVKFDAKVVGGVGSKFMVRHSNSSHKGIDGASAPLMESSSKGTSHVFTTDLTNEIVQNSKFFTVLSNGSMGMDKIELQVTNIEITTLGTSIPSDTQMIRIAGRDDNGKARAIRVNEKGEIQTVNSGNSSVDNSRVAVVNSKQIKPTIAKMGEALLESDTGKVFHYDGTEWREFV